MILKVVLKAPKNDVIKMISSQIILKTLRYPSSTVLLPRLTSNVSYYQQSQIMIMKQKSSVRAFSRSYTYPNHLVFANYMLKHLYQIMIRRLRPLYLKIFGHLASHYGKEIRYTSRAYSYPYRLRFSKYMLKHLYQIIIRSY